MSAQLLPFAPAFHTALPGLAAEARDRAVEIEAARRLPADFATKLKRAGAFRLLVPEAGGGLGLSLPDWLEAMLTLAEADASTGWVTAHANICSALIHGSAEPRFRDEFFSDPEACAAWSNLARVQAEETAEGLRLSGSWSFASGCTASTFVGGMVTLPPGADGKPRLIAVLAPVADAEIADTWDPVGLAGTGSHDIVFRDVLVPWHRTFSWPNGKPRSGSVCDAYVGNTWFIAIGAAVTHLGLGRRALDEVRKELQGKADRYSRIPLLEHPATQRSLEAAEGLWYACRAGLREALASIWETARQGRLPDQDQRLAARLATITATQRCADVVRAAYDAAGAGAIRRGGVLQRLLRDASCLTHHVSANQASYEQTGRVRAGIDRLSFRI